MTFRISSIRSRCRRGVLHSLGLLAALTAAASAVGGTNDSAAAGGPAGAVTLRYAAFLAGAPVGEAAVSVTVADGRYQVEGDARSNGWLKGFTRWRNRFAAQGQVDGPHREPAEFSYTETDSDKERHLIVRDGTMQVTKNGRRRPPRPAPAGPDVISALFVQPHCGNDQVLHTGRHVYRLTRLQQNPAGCRYEVTDDDGDTFEVELELGSREGLVVPEKITAYAWVTGWVELTDAEARSAE